MIAELRSIGFGLDRDDILIWVTRPRRLRRRRMFLRSKIEALITADGGGAGLWLTAGYLRRRPARHSKRVGFGNICRNRDTFVHRLSEH